MEKCRRACLVDLYSPLRWLDASREPTIHCEGFEAVETLEALDGTEAPGDTTTLDRIEAVDSTAAVSTVDMALGDAAIVGWIKAADNTTAKNAVCMAAVGSLRCSARSYSTLR